MACVLTIVGKSLDERGYERDHIRALEKEKKPQTVGKSFPKRVFVFVHINRCNMIYRPKASIIDMNRPLLPLCG